MNPGFSEIDHAVESGHTARLSRYKLFGSIGALPRPHFARTLSKHELYSSSVQVDCTANAMDLVVEEAVRPRSERASALAAELRAVLGKLKRKMREHGGRNDLTPSQVSVILRLEKDGPSTVSSLARAEGMRPQSMSAIIAALLDAELVSGSPDPSDARQTLMSLSSKCLEAMKEGRAAKQDWLTHTIREKLSYDDQEKLADVLKLLARLVED